MKRDIILSGVGGQGILSIAAIIGEAALRKGLYVKQAEVHGMSQRGGDVQSNLRLSSEPIHSDLIPKGGTDAIIAMEPMEALRYLPYLSPEGWIVTNSATFVNIPNYPNEEQLLGALRARSRVILIDADTLAKDNGMPRAVNMVLLGAASAILGLDADLLEEAVAGLFAAKGADVVDMNVRAFRLGREAGTQQVKDSGHAE